MTPTAKLRWLDRLYGVGDFPPDWEPMYERVLQQWWIDESTEIDATFEGEWRDVPLEEET